MDEAVLKNKINDHCNNAIGAINTTASSVRTLHGTLLADGVRGNGTDYARLIQELHVYLEKAAMDIIVLKRLAAEPNTESKQ
jgi:hypothetical protein